MNKLEKVNSIQHPINLIENGNKLPSEYIKENYRKILDKDLGKLGMTKKELDFKLNESKTVKIGYNKSLYKISKTKITFGNYLYAVEKFNMFKYYEKTYKNHTKKYTKMRYVEEWKKVKRDLIHPQEIQNYLSNFNEKNS